MNKIARPMVIIVVSIFGLLILSALIKGGLGKKGLANDYSVGMVTDKGVGLVTVSWQRRLVSELTVKPESKIWVPNGPGWYQSNNVKRLLEQEGKQSEAGDLFFYNFGIMPDTIILSADTDWLSHPDVVRAWGWINWIRLRFLERRVLWNMEEIDGFSSEKEIILNRIVPRDFADGDILKEDVKVSVYNSSKENGLANWLSTRLERGGFSVNTVSNGDNDTEGCLVIYSNTIENSLSMLKLKNIFKSCDFRVESELGEGQVELYFGDKYTKMLNYQSYNY